MMHKELSLQIAMTFTVKARTVQGVRVSSRLLAKV